MKRIIFLGTIIISLVLFCCCDDRFNNNNNEGGGNNNEEQEDYITGNPAYEHTNEGTVMYWGKDTYGGFYGFIDGGQRHYLEDSENSIIDVYISNNNVYTLSWFNTGEKNPIVLWKNTDMMYDYLNGIFRKDKFFVDVYNDIVRLYSEIPDEFDVYSYIPQYWEDKQYYNLDLEMITYSSMPLFSQPQGIIRAYGNVYYFSFSIICGWNASKTDVLGWIFI